MNKGFYGIPKNRTYVPITGISSPFPYTGSANITGSLTVTGSVSISNDSSISVPLRIIDSNAGAFTSKGITFDCTATGPDQPILLQLGSTNAKGISFFASNLNISPSPDGAAFQMFNNSSVNFPGQVYFDGGAHDNSSIIFRTAITSDTITQRMRIFSGGNIQIGSSTTDAGYKLDINGTTRHNFSNTDYTNINGANSHILLTNPSSTGQNVISSFINGNLVAKWRTDYVGNISWVAGSTGEHDFLTGGDYGAGSIKMRIFNGGNVQIATNPVGGQISDSGYKLDVSGSGRYTGGLTVTGSLLVQGNIIPGGPYTANTSSYNLGSPTAAWKDIYVSNGSLIFISGSTSSSINLGTNGVLNITGSLQGTASWANNALTSSYINTLNQSVTISGSTTVRSALATGMAFQVLSGSSTILYAGTNISQTRVGIRTSTPLYSFDVNGNTNFTPEEHSGYLRISPGQSSTWNNPTFFQTSFGSTLMLNNAYYTASTGQFIRATNGYAAGIQLEPSLGGIEIFTAPYGTAGTAFSTFTSRISITNSGSVGINNTSPSYSLDVSGSGRFLNGLIITGSLNASSITGSLQGTASWANNATTSSYVNTLNQNVTIIPPSTPGSGVGLVISGSNNKGGTGYLDFLQVTNTSASIANPNKYFRLNTVGDIEILRSDYGASILALTNGGILRVGGDNLAATSNNDPTTNYLSFGSNNTVIYDDGNTHIHSRSSGQSMWINTNGGQLNLITQTPVNGGASGSGVAIGSSTLTGYVTINRGKSYTTAANYGYLTTGGAGTYPGGSQTLNISLYATDRIWGQEIDAFSDERMKDIHGEITLEDGLKLVKTLKPIKYTWKDNSDKGLKVGYSAQQVSKAGFDHLISLIPKEGLEETIDDDGFVSPKDTQFSMNYDQVTPYHGVVIKYLLEKIEQLEQEIKELKK